MSRVVEWWIRCDRCGIHQERQSPYERAADARQRMAQKGWTRQGKTDVCPGCSAAKVAESTSLAAQR
jgi:hypothetical protein